MKEKSDALREQIAGLKKALENAEKGTQAAV